MRSAAKNFSKEDMIEGVEFAHRMGKRVFVTVNIIPRSEDLISLADYIKELDGTLVEYTEKTFKYYVYNDYSNLNNQLIDRYNFPMKIFYEEIPYIPNKISEIPIDRLNLIVDKTGILIEESKKGKKYLFKIDEIITFIESSKKTILKELDSIYEKN